MCFKDELQQFNDLKREKKLIEKQIMKLKTDSNNIVSDKVYASSREFPYMKRGFIIQGITDQKGYRRRIDRRCKKLAIIAEEISIKEEEIEEFIHSIPDSKTRQVFTYRYMMELSWREIARKMNYSESAVRFRIHDCYLRNLEK